MLNTGSLSGISLFTGAGGMDVGFSKAGIQTVFANDIDLHACRSFEENHGAVIHLGSITDYLGSLYPFIGTDVVFGGPPCQGFSVAGKMDPNDIRSELIHTFFDVVDLIGPRAFVCENVKALATLDKWAGVRAEIRQRASKDYHSALIVLDSSDFGVPQKRERMFFIGVQKGGAIQSDDQLMAQLQESLKRRERKAATVAELIRSFGRAGSINNPRICSAKITYAKNPVMRKSPYAGMLFNGAGRPLDPNGYSSTLPASMGGNKTPIVDEGSIFDGLPCFITQYHRELMAGTQPRTGEAPSRLRRLTVDECLAIQTFPSDYKLSGSQSSMYKQIGNAVPCVLAEAVALSVKDILEAN